MFISRVTAFSRQILHESKKSSRIQKILDISSASGKRSYCTSSILNGPVVIPSENADPSMKKYKFWNREEYATKGKYDYIINISPDSIQREAKILNLSGPDDEANSALFENLPYGAQILKTGTKLVDFEDIGVNEPNVVFVSPSCPKARKQLPLLLARYPSIEWVHVRSAGIDFVVSDALSELPVFMTNAKGQFSSSLAEYTMLACSYFAKDLPR